MSFLFLNLNANILISPIFLSTASHFYRFSSRQSGPIISKRSSATLWCSLLLFSLDLRSVNICVSLLRLRLILTYHITVRERSTGRLSAVGGPKFFQYFRFWAMLKSYKFYKNACFFSLCIYTESSGKGAQIYVHAHFPVKIFFMLVIYSNSIIKNTEKTAHFWRLENQNSLYEYESFYIHGEKNFKIFPKTEYGEM